MGRKLSYDETENVKRLLNGEWMASISWSVEPGSSDIDSWCDKLNAINCYSSKKLVVKLSVKLCIRDTQLPKM